MMKLSLVMYLPKQVQRVFGESTNTLFGMLHYLKTLYGALTRWGYLNAHITAHDTYSIHAAISVKVIPEQSRKMQYDRESLLNFLAIPRKPFALVFDISALLGENH